MEARCLGVVDEMGPETMSYKEVVFRDVQEDAMVRFGFDRGAKHVGTRGSVSG